MSSPVRGPAPHSQGRWHRTLGGLSAEQRNGFVRSERSERADHEPHGVRSSQASAEQAPRRQQQAPVQGEESLLAALAAAGASRSTVRYRGFVLLPQPDLGWLVRPERSPMTVLPFRTPPISLCDVKALVDWRLDQVLPRARPQR